MASLSSNGAPATASFDGIIPALSADGTRVAFESRASDLVPGDDNKAYDVFLHDSSTEETSLVSARAPERPAQTGPAMTWLARKPMSADGRYVLLLSGDSFLADADTNIWWDLFRRDLQDSKAVAVSLGTDNRQTTPDYHFSEDVEGAALSADGRYLTYEVTQGRAIDGFFDANIFWRDLETGSNSPANLLPPSLASFSQAPTISPDGQRVVFHGVESPSVAVFLWTNGATANLSLSGSPNRNATNAVFSPDGQWVFFHSAASNLTTNTPVAGVAQLFGTDLQTGEIRLFSYDQTGGGLAETPGDPAFSGDGRYFAFDTRPSGVIYRHDLQADNTQTNSPFIPNLIVCSNAFSPSLNMDGNLVAYESAAPGEPQNIFLRNITTGDTELISVKQGGTGGGNGHSSHPILSPDGRFVIFTSRASDLVSNDQNGWPDVFIRDRLLHITTLASSNAQGTASGNGPSGRPVLSADGHTLAFESFANDLIEGDYNDTQDIFVLHLGTGDSDGDGLDDDWEMAYFDSLEYDGTGDFDADGQTDRAEYLAGTDPTNAGSVLRALTLTHSGSGTTTILWAAVAGKNYQIQYKNALDDSPWSDLPGVITATGPTGTAVDDTSGAPARFYRVRLVP